MQDVITRTCAKCGQPVDRTKDSFKSLPGGEVSHASCPTSPELKALPAVQLAPPGVQFVRIEEAARMLTVSVDTIRRRIRTGELPAKRLRGAADGGRQTILIDQADVLALLEPYLPSNDEGATHE